MSTTHTKTGVNRQGAVQGTPINNGGTIAHAGKVPATGATNNAGLGEVLGAGNPIPNKPAKHSASGNSAGVSHTSSPTRPGVIEANSAATFARDNEAGKYIMKRVSTTIGNTSNNVLLSGASADGQGKVNSSIGKLESYRTLPRYSFSADGSILAKVASPGGVSNGGTAKNYVNPVGGGASADSAANPTRAIPGELVYTATSLARSGSLAVPKQDDYKPKTG